MEVWRAFGYARLSKEEKDAKNESGSITNQKEMIRSFTAQHPDLQLVGIFADDGYSGHYFDNRPGFGALLDEIQNGTCNCIILKDLSRLGRNMVETGAYLREVFPNYNVRVIAINDSYDSLSASSQNDDLIVPFLNLINESYYLDLSKKIRSSLEARRKNGDYTGNYAAYGYQKDPQNHSRLIIDEFAADVVRDIFRWKMEGYNSKTIAEKLNASGVPAPADHKKQQGLNYTSGLSKGVHSRWYPSTVHKILSNPVYIGVLQQGRTRVVNTGATRTIAAKPREEWIIVNDAHPPIVERRDFDLVQELLLIDTAEGADGRVPLFAGLLTCGDCGGPIFRQSVPYNGKYYVYYRCRAAWKAKSCYPYKFTDKNLYPIILDCVRERIRDVINIDELLKRADLNRIQDAHRAKVQELVVLKEAEMERLRFLLSRLLQHLDEGVLSEEDYSQNQLKYSRNLQEAEEQMKQLQAELTKSQNAEELFRWLETFRMNENVVELDRCVLISMISQIYLYHDNRIEIRFRFESEYRVLMEQF